MSIILYFCLYFVAYVIFQKNKKWLSLSNLATLTSFNGPRISDHF